MISFQRITRLASLPPSSEVQKNFLRLLRARALQALGTAFGFNVPMVLDKDNVIICGHTRYLAAQKIGLKKVPAIIAIHLTDLQVKAYRIADNRVALESDWEADLLKDEVMWLDSEGDLMHELFTGFDPIELANILDPLADFNDDEKETPPKTCPHCGKVIE